MKKIFFLVLFLPLVAQAQQAVPNIQAPQTIEQAQQLSKEVFEEVLPVWGKIREWVQSIWKNIAEKLQGVFSEKIEQKEQEIHQEIEKEKQELVQDASLAGKSLWEYLKSLLRKN